MIRMGERAIGMTAERQKEWLEGGLEREGKDALGFVQSRNIRHAKKYHSQKERAYAPRIMSGVECLLFEKRS